jgi:hypothetical protein
MQYKFIFIHLNIFVFSVIFGLLTAENDSCIDKAQAERLIREWEQGYWPQEVASLFSEVKTLIDFKGRG